MSRGFKTLLIVIAVVVVLLLSLIGNYNKMVSLDQSVKQSESDIDTQLQRRSDLIPNLIATVKGYASQEKDIFTAVADARSKLAGAQTITAKAEADNQVSGSLSRLLAVVENYPNLKSDQNFRDLSVALEGTENRINIARKDYNNEVGNYNSTIKRFPNVIIAGIFRFEQKPYYKAAEGAKEVPKVDFSKVK
ncbi:LemA family protein [Clostridium akagii]|uniref:LemA family protein n=1 Tax=Clostridium akagii TaxID=91623 RepID=UPI000478D502|nr:LemA family protein [Clostridium akagii]